MSDDKIDLKIIYLVITLISLIVIFNFHDVNATVVTHNSATTSGPSWFGNVYVQKFTGLPVGHSITNFGVWTSTNGSGKFFSAPPVGAHTTGLSGILWASKYSASAGSHINDIALDVSATGSGHVRVKLYSDSSGPNTLIAESGSIAVSGTGLQYFPITADFPASGNVWAAFETDTNSMDLFEGTNSNIQGSSHVYGAGPNPFGSFLCPSCTQPYIGINYTISSSALRIKGYQDDGSGGNPSTLLGETSPLAITTGKQNFTISPPFIVPASGNMWIGFEANTTSWGPFHGAVVTLEQIIAHTFGAGPNPFGVGICPTCTDEIWSQVTYNDGNLVLVPTSGNVGSTVTASGSGFSPSTTVTHSFSGFTSGSSGSVRVEQFTGLPANANVTQIGLNILTNGTQSQSIIHTSTGVTFGPSGKVSVEKFTGMPTTNGTITSLSFVVNSGSGNVRLKFYNDSSGSPSTLLADAGPFATSGTGTQTFNVSVTIPKTGIIWAGLETDSDTLGIQATNTQNFGSTFVAHTYGTGPNPFGSGSVIQSWSETITYHDTLNPHVRVKIYDDTGANAPHNLLGESGPVLTLNTGLQEYTVSALVPANGIVWAGIETDSDSLGFQATNTQNFGSVFVTHTFGSGPNPFGSGGVAAAWNENLIYTTKPLSLKWDGIPLSTNPLPITKSDTGTFSGVTFSVPSSAVGSHVVNASEVGGTFATANFIINPYSVSLKPLLHDGVTPITSGKLIVTQNGVSIGTGNTNSSGYATVSGLSGGNYNFTIMDDKNFAVYKELNTNVSGNITKNVSTYDTPLNCVGYYNGYQSDFILRINDTDGTYITNISKPDCTSLTDILFSMTFSPLGKSGNSFSTSMLTSIGNLAYQANAKQFTVNGNNVTTIFTGNTNLISNPFAIGSGLVSHTVNFDIKLGAVQQVIPNPSGSPNPPPPPPITCTDPLGCSGNTCQYGINPDGTCFDPSCPAGENCNHLQCPPNSILYQNECLANQNQVCPDGSLAVNGVCPTGNPSCPAGTIPLNGGCITPSPMVCPDGSAPVNGVCNSGNPSCPANTILINGNCVVVNPPNPNQCSLGTNPDGSCITTPSQTQCTANPLLCLLGGGAGGKDVTVSGITYTPTVDIVQLGQIKNEVIGISWDSSSDLIMGTLYFSTNSSFGFSPMPAPPYNMTGTIGGHSSGSIKYILTVPSSYCSQTVVTNCLDPKISTFVVPVSISVILDGKEVRNTIFMKITVLTQQTIATYLIVALAMFALLGVLISRIKKQKKKPKRVVPDKKPKTKTDKTKYLKESKG